MKALGNKIISILFTIIIVASLNLIVVYGINFDFKNQLTLSFEVNSQQDDVFQIFYSEDGNWNEEECRNIEYNSKNQKQRVKCYLPKTARYIRLDVGTKIGEVLIEDINLIYAGKKINLSDKLIKPNAQSQISDVKKDGETITITTIGDDPFVAIDMQELNIATLYRADQDINRICKTVSIVALNLLLITIFRNHKKIASLMVEFGKSRRLIWKLSKNDFQTKYAGSYLGITWAFVQPIVTILVYWFVFQVGFKSAPVEDFPFVLWLVAGMVPWFFYSEATINASNSLIEYSYLVKKVVFKISILPVVKILSSLFVHMFFIGFTIFLFGLYGYMPTLYMIQIIYYTFCIFVLVLGLSYLTAAVQVFFKDLGQIINIFMQIGMWLTPIMWSYSMIDEQYQWILKINPMFYIVQGYRDSLIDKVWLWERATDTFYFWTLTLTLFGVGCLIFKRLKIHFADVL